VGNDHILDFSDVVAFDFFLWLALSSHSVPFKHPLNPIKDRVALARNQESILYGLQALDYRVSFFQLCHDRCAGLAARSPVVRLGACFWTEPRGSLAHRIQRFFPVNSNRSLLLRRECVTNSVIAAVSQPSAPKGSKLTMNAQ